MLFNRYIFYVYKTFTENVEITVFINQVKNLLKKRNFHNNGIHLLKDTTTNQ